MISLIVYLSCIFHSALGVKIHAFEYGSYGVYFGGYSVSQYVIDRTSLNFFHLTMTEECDAGKFARVLNNPEIYEQAIRTGGLGDHINFLSKALQILSVRCGKENELQALTKLVITILKSPNRPAIFKRAFPATRFQELLEKLAKVEWRSWQVPSTLKTLSPWDEALVERTLLLISDHVSEKNAKLDFMENFLKDYKLKFVHRKRQVNIHIAPDTSMLLAQLALRACSVSGKRWIKAFQEFVDDMVIEQQFEMLVTIAFELNTMARGEKCLERVFNAIQMDMDKQAVFPVIEKPQRTLFFQNSPYMQFPNHLLHLAPMKVTVKNGATNFFSINDSTGREDSSLFKSDGSIAQPFKFELELARMINGHMALVKGNAENSRFLITRIRAISQLETIAEGTTQTSTEPGSMKLGAQLSYSTVVCKNGPCKLTVVAGDILVIQDHPSQSQWTRAERAAVEGAWWGEGPEILLQLAASFPISTFYHAVLIA